jgi:hypothetical protein
MSLLRTLAHISKFVGILVCTLVLLRVYIPTHTQNLAWIHTLVQEAAQYISEVFLLLLLPLVQCIALSKMYRFFIHNNQVKCSVPHEDYDSLESLDAASPIIGGEYNSYIDHEADEYPTLWQYNAETQELYKLDYLTCKAEIESN